MADHHPRSELDRQRLLSQVTSAALLSFDGGLQVRGDHSPANFGRYRLLRIVDWAPDHALFVAHDPLLDRHVNIEMFAATDADRQLAVARKLATVAVPGVATVYEADELGGIPCLVSERVEGPRLAQWAAGQRWPERLGAYLLAGHALADIHAAGVALGFAAEQVIVTAEGRVCIAEFALGRSPESESHDVESDQRRFCLSLWTVLAGQPPSGSNSDSQLESTIPTSVVTALRRGLAGDPVQQYPSMTELLDALQPDHRLRIRDGLAVVVTTARQRIVVGLGLTAMATLAFMLGTGTADRQPSDPTLVELAVGYAPTPEPDLVFAIATALVLDADEPEDPAAIAHRYIEFADRYASESEHAELVWRTGFAVAEMLSSLARWTMAHDQAERALVLFEAGDRVFERLLAELSGTASRRRRAVTLQGHALLLRSYGRLSGDWQLGRRARELENISVAQWQTAEPLELDPYVETPVMPPLVCEPPPSG